MEKQTKQKETMKIDLKNHFEIDKYIPQKTQKLIIGLCILLVLIQGISAYSLSFPMMNLWDVFVEQLFGSFWVAVAFISLIFFIILMLGGISYYTVLIFMLYFLLAMGIGYGYPIIPAFIAIFGTWYLVTQAFRWWDNR